MDSDSINRSTSRRGFLLGAAAAGAGIASAGALGGPLTALADTARRDGLSTGDKNILGAASIAEALAVTTYTHIINTAPFFKRLPADDQKYLTAAREEEMSHYDLEISLTGKDSPYTEFYYPKGMFTSTQTTLNALVMLEDAFIAAYLVGVGHFSTTGLRVAAARIMGIESDHRTLARAIGGDVAARDGGPITMITGAQGKAEPVSPPNNNGYERTLSWTSINDAVKALTPFLSKTAAASAGFDTSKAYKFHPFKPTLPSSLGNY